MRSMVKKKIEHSEWLMISAKPGGATRSGLGTWTHHSNSPLSSRSLPHKQQHSQLASLWSPILDQSRRLLPYKLHRRKRSSLASFATRQYYARSHAYGSLRVYGGNVRMEYMDGRSAAALFLFAKFREKRAVAICVWYVGWWIQSGGY